MQLDLQLRLRLLQPRHLLSQHMRVLGVDVGLRLMLGVVLDHLADLIAQ